MISFIPIFPKEIKVLLIHEIETLDLRAVFRELVKVVLEESGAGPQLSKEAVFLLEGL